MKRRVLIVTGSYAPAMIADMQRARQLAWELPKLDWEVEVLSPSTEYQPASCIDEDSREFFSPYAKAHYVPKLFPTLFKMAGVGNIGWRALLPLWSAGRRLLKQNHFDMIYISTAQFPLFLLGPLWQTQLGVPYVLDLHDPLYREGTSHPTWAKPSLKHYLSSLIARQVESYIAERAQGVIAVSPNYINAWRRRYESEQPAWLGSGRSEAIPFSALPRDLCEAAKGVAPDEQAKEPPFRIAYAGVGGAVMARSFTLFTQALSRLRIRNPELCKLIRVDLLGTILGWQPGQARTLADIAAKWGIDDLIQEDPCRLSYRRSLELLLRSRGALILGVDDVGYMPSKLFNYALSGKPLLATVHRDGPAFAKFQSIPELGHAIWIGQDKDMPVEEAMDVLESFLREVVTQKTFDRSGNIAPYLAPTMAKRHAEVFEACL
jgi:hypothetical protein